MICAAPVMDGAWWRAQVISFYKDSSEVEIRYVDYGGYERVKIDTLRQIRFLMLLLTVNHGSKRFLGLPALNYSVLVGRIL